MLARSESVQYQTERWPPVACPKEEDLENKKKPTTAACTKSDSPLLSASFYPCILFKTQPSCSTFRLVRASLRTAIFMLLPPPVGPTTMRPCRTQIISYSSIAFVRKMGTWREVASNISFRHTSFRFCFAHYWPNTFLSLMAKHIKRDSTVFENGKAGTKLYKMVQRTKKGTKGTKGTKGVSISLPQHAPKWKTADDSPKSKSHRLKPLVLHGQLERA